jgi:hypothetical protein
MSDSTNSACDADRAAKRFPRSSRLPGSFGCEYGKLDIRERRRLFSLQIGTAWPWQCFRAPVVPAEWWAGAGQHAHGRGGSACLVLQRLAQRAADDAVIVPVSACRVKADPSWSLCFSELATSSTSRPILHKQRCSSGLQPLSDGIDTRNPRKDYCAGVMLRTNLCRFEILQTISVAV